VFWVIIVRMPDLLWRGLRLVLWLVGHVIRGVRWNGHLSCGVG
jgi:hypothetical protein